MISFIVIGLNEGWRLSKCFNSIHELVEFNQISNYEIIYVDSSSSDSSIELSKSHGINKIYRIEGEINAAIARNVGAKNASGDILFFLDGDIELIPFAISSIVSKQNTLLFNYVVGYLEDVNYDNNWSYINSTIRDPNPKMEDKPVAIIGGAIIVISNILWEKVDGMDIRLKRNEDRDFSLRLAKKGVLGIRKFEIKGKHHTIPYIDKHRKWKMIFDGSFRYKSVMIRKHLLNPKFMSLFLREEYTLIFLIFSLVLSLISINFLLLYITIVILRNLKKSSSISQFMSLVIHRIFQDFIVLFSLFFFHPRKPIFSVEVFQE